LGNFGTCVASVDSDGGDVNKGFGSDKILSVKVLTLALVIISFTRKYFSWNNEF
jgi:hypothetical protein